MTATPEGDRSHPASQAQPAASSSSAAAGTRRRLAGARAPLLAGCLALLLVGTRSPGLGKSLWHDEAYSALHYVAEGPRGIWDGATYVPNNHVLYSLVTWITVELVGRDEAVLRLWAVVPGIVGALWLCWYLRRQIGHGCAIAVGLLVLSSSMHQALTVQARGYGLAFLAGAALFIGADSALRGPQQGRYETLAAVAGFAGAATINIFAIAVAAVFGVLLACSPDRRRALALKLLVMSIALAAWWLPLVEGILANADQQYGRQLPWNGPVLGWLQDLGLTEIIDAVGAAGDPAAASLILASTTEWLALVAMASAILATGLVLVRTGQLDRLALLLAPLLSTYAVMTLGRFYVSPRFAFHLVPFLLVLLVLGPAEIVRTMPTRTSMISVAACLTLLVVPMARRLDTTAEAAARPLEAFEDVATLIASADRRLPISTNSARPTGFEYYLERSFDIEDPIELVMRTCRRRQPEIIIDHPYRTRSLDFTCERAREATRIDIPQRIRGNHMSVWFFPERGAGDDFGSPP